MTTVWDSDGWTPLPALARDVTADVCVVGLGGSGLTAVHELLDRGASVVGIDAGTVAGGAAGRNGGFLLAGLAHPHHRVVDAIGRQRASVLHRLTLGEMARIAAATPHVRITGSLRVEDTAEGLADCADQLAALRADGFAVQEYAGPEGSGLLFPDDGVLQPLARCRTLASSAYRALLFESTPALGIRPGVVTTPGGSVRCGTVLVCVDGRLEQLLPELVGVVRTVRLQMLATATADDVQVPRPVYLRDGHEYWQQLPDGRIALGGFRDVGGPAEETHSTEPTAPVQDALDRHLRSRIGTVAPVTARWAASVGYTRTGLPFAGEVRPGVLAAGGYCGTGNVVGALCARALVSLALGYDDPSRAFLDLRRLP